jgi:phage shock protein E
MRALLAAAAFALLLAPPLGRADGASERDRLVAQTPPGLVDAATARKLVAAGVKVVDVRTPAEFQSGHVPGAVNIPFDQMAQRAGELGPPSTPLVLYCRSGRRSGIAVGTLKRQGFSRLYDLQAYDRWVASEPAGK